MMRSLAAIVGGFLAYAFMMGFTVLVLQTVFPVVFGPGALQPRPLWAMGIEISYSVVWAVLGGYVAALIARRDPVTHAGFLAAIVLMLGIVNLMSSAQTNQPVWYQITLIVLSALAVVIGGMLRARQATAPVME
jgi:hypothetical protein